MNPVDLIDALEPDQWFVVFHRDSAASPRWISFLAMGEFKHVSAFAYCAGFKLWLIYDTQLNGTRLRLLPHGDPAIARLTEYMRGCAVIKIDRKFDPVSWTSRLGFYCVPAMKHLLGVHCASMRPDGLYRALLRNGGVLLNATGKSPATAAGSAVGDRATAGAAVANF